MSIENPTPGGSFGGDGAATTGSARNPGGQFAGIGRLGVEGRGLASSILWIGPEPPTGTGYLLWINTSDGRWYGYWNDGTSTQWVDLSLPFGEGLQGPAGIEGPKGDKGDTGQGIPVGGTANQILVKNSATDYDTSWGARPADGNSVLNGAVDPTVEGVDGDFYLNTVTYDIFGPKAGGVWPAGVSLIGPTGATGAAGADGADGADGVDGRTVLNGTVDPTTEGVDGDFYINTTTSFIFGPKAAGVWPAGVSLIGPTGPAGADGADGAGVPAGGTTGQILAKIDGTDNNTEWVDPPTGTVFSDVALLINAAGKPDTFIPVDESPAGRFLTYAGANVLSGTMEFSGSSEYIEVPDSGPLQPLDNDFVITIIDFNIDDITGGHLEGIIGQWNAASSRRSWLFRTNGADLEFFESPDGTTGTLRLSHTIAATTNYKVVLRRVGGTITLEVDDVVQDTWVAGGSYSFFDASADPVQIGTYSIGTRDLNGSFESLQYEISGLQVEEKEFPDTQYVVANASFTVDDILFDGLTVVEVDNASPVTVTLATGLVTPKELVIVQKGAGQVTIAAGGSTLLSPDSLVATRVQNSMIAIMPTKNTDEFRLAGDLA